ncbi:RagB/SusD family nutrient uptake outer membrane protein [Aliifodinibius sp. S!AR15-10]|uniref:RagB/SusD family nutrient uptake outer membrane protein n=1 Tax=Aliifodinibius sp. S!AR15-10 TaxID=2950437 RepID=UPI0028567134|nr:RagB/SusD family nutrient uptake outer membrane protein [Aliifodinibius sp. S!AR15-10]MDR8393573.1 RagB/SusD family nutrient uptake outer membrane protein [Aliifodinibius sp. S!AR15-10]
MIKQGKYIALFLCAVLLCTSCGDEFLEIEPPGSLTTGTFYETEADAISGINSAYASLQTASMYSENYPKAVEAGTDDVILHNATALSLDSWTFAADVNPIDLIWQACYEGIFRSNLVRQQIPSIEMADPLRDRILGEALFLRALFYWHLTTLFGDVPLIKQADTENLERSLKPKSTQQEIYQFMIGNFKKASSLLPLRSEYGPENLGRATKGAALALLGKVYLYDEKYGLAETYFDSVITSGQYQLIDDYSKLWVEDNNGESIFEVQYRDVGGNAWATQDAATSNEGNLRLYLNLPQGRGGFANLLPTQDLVDEFESHDGPTAIDGKDPRLFYNIFRQGDPYDEIDPVYDESWTPTGYAMKKGMLPIHRNEEANSRNVVLIRFADVLLMAAEAANANGKQNKAVDLINRVRHRVGMPDLPTAEYPVGNSQQIFRAIVHERRVELAFEYHRLNDLRRWELADEELEGFEFPKHQYFPIPQSELYVNSELEQNPNY